MIIIQVFFYKRVLIFIKKLLESSFKYQMETKTTKIINSSKLFTMYIKILYNNINKMRKALTKF